MPREEFSVYLGVKVTATQDRRLKAYAGKAKGEGQADLVRRAIDELLNREDGKLKLPEGNKVTIACRRCGGVVTSTEIPDAVAKVRRHNDTVHGGVP